MDISMEIAAQAMSMQSLRFQQDYAVAVTKKAMESQELAGQELVRMLSAAAPAVPKGSYVDVYA